MNEAADARRRALRAWLASALGDEVEVQLLAGDASFRRYYRARRGDRSWVVMDAPPPHEEVTTFCDVARRLRAAGLGAPAIHAEEPSAGFLLLDDLGDDLYLDVLDEHTAPGLYQAAIEALVRMQVRVSAEGLPDYDRELLLGEMRLFPDWFVEVHLRARLSEQERRTMDEAFELLASAALAQPKVFVHRDYHSRNLVAAGTSPGILDFQDAVLGPVTYDLVSLLKDVYISWPRWRLEEWTGLFLDRAIAGSVLSDGDRAHFPRWLDLMGVQRHLKVAGIFARLNYRDGKAAYLDDLPLTLRYLDGVWDAYPELGGLADIVRRLWVGRG